MHLWCSIGTTKKYDIEQVFQFFMDLHDPYTSIRSQILAMDPHSSISKDYSILHQEEKQCLLHLLVVLVWSAIDRNGNKIGGWLGNGIRNGPLSFCNGPWLGNV